MASLKDIILDQYPRSSKEGKRRREESRAIAMLKENGIVLNFLQRHELQGQAALLLYPMHREPE